MMVSAAYAQPPSSLFKEPVPVEDIAVSRYGQYAASVGVNELSFYDRTHRLWSWSSSENLYSVAISADGNSVVAGGASHVFFWKNAISRSSDTSFTWESVPYGTIYKRCLDISADGGYVLAGSQGYGSEPTVLYWAGASSKSGVNVAYAWAYLGPGGPLVSAVDLSDNGDYAVAIGYWSTLDGNAVGYWKNARTRVGSGQAPNWLSYVSPGFRELTDVAVSDDGYSVAASGFLGSSAVYYWAGATGLTDNPPTSWNADFSPTVEFLSVDMSCDGDSVVAGAESDLVYFWSGARTLTGKPQSPSWKYPTVGYVEEVAINDAGTYMAAATATHPLPPLPPEGNVYFLDRTGVMKWSTPYLLDGPVTSMSICCDGGTLAVGDATRSAYLFDTGFSDPCCGAAVAAAPVGGALTAVDRLAVLTPYLALLGAIAAVTVAVAISRKKPKN
jgi:hypothetical protein